MTNFLGILHGYLQHISDECFPTKKPRVPSLSLNIFNSIIETVKLNCYLIIVLRYNGKFNSAINTLMEKARKAFFKLKKEIITLNNPCKLVGKLFDITNPFVVKFGEYFVN